MGVSRGAHGNALVESLEVRGNCLDLALQGLPALGRQVNIAQGLTWERQG